MSDDLLDAISKQYSAIRAKYTCEEIIRRYTSEDPQMVIEMYKEWQASSPNMLIPEGEELFFRGVPVRLLRDVNTEAGERDV